MIDTNTRTPKNQEIGHLLICVYFINLMSFKIEIFFLNRYTLSKELLWEPWQSQMIPQTQT